MEVRERVRLVVLPTVTAVILLVVGVFSAIDWQQTTSEATVRTDILGRQRMLTVVILDLAARTRDGDDWTAQLEQRLDLYLDQWDVGLRGGEELDIDLQPTGRTLGPMPEAGDFDETGSHLRGFAAGVRASITDGVTQAELDRWRPLVDELVPEIDEVVSTASSNDSQSKLVVAGAAFALAIGAVSWMTAALSSRRRRVVDVVSARADESQRTTHRFERILADVPDDILLVDRHGDLTWASSGLGFREPITSIDQLESLVHPDDVHDVRILLNGRGDRRHDADAPIRIATPESGWRHVELVVTDLLDDPDVVASVVTLHDVTERLDAEAEQLRLADTNEFLTSNSSEVLMRLDRHGTVLEATAALTPMLELEPSDITGVRLHLLLSDQSVPVFDELVDDALRTSITQRADVELKGAAVEHTVWCSAGVKAVLDHDGRQSLHVSFLDITERRAAEKALADAAAQQHLILNTLSEAVVLSDRSNEVIMANAAALGLGFRPNSQRSELGPPLFDGIEEVSGDRMADGDSPTERVLRSGEPEFGRLLRFTQSNGPAVEVAVAAVPCERDENGDVALVVTTCIDVTGEMEARRLLERQATTDALTGLPNRLRIEQVLDEAVIRNGRRTEFVTLLFIDLDGFKPVNDELGHVAGDEVLVQAGQRLSDAVRAEDVVGRIGGDEFVVVVEHPESAEQAETLARRIGQLFEIPFEVSVGTASVGASIGIASLQPEQTAGDLLNVADGRMYEEKRRRSARTGSDDRRTSR